jgi:nitrogen regulatory protein PII-like uncharacterized protein
LKIKLYKKTKDKTIKIESEQGIVHIGSLVRIKLVKTVFGDKLQSKLTDEIYTVIKTGKTL